MIGLLYAKYVWKKGSSDYYIGAVILFKFQFKDENDGDEWKINQFDYFCEPSSTRVK